MGYQEQFLSRRTSKNLISASVDTTVHLQTTSEPPLSVCKHCEGSQSWKWEEVKISSLSKPLCCSTAAQLLHAQGAKGGMEGKNCLFTV